MNILVLGGGTFGTAIANELSVNKENSVVLFSRNKKKVDEIRSLNTNKSCFPNKKLSKRLNVSADKKLIHHADIVFIALPSIVIIETLLNLKSYFKDIIDYLEIQESDDSHLINCKYHDISTIDFTKYKENVIYL